jgi:hypothetical protein
MVGGIDARLALAYIFKDTQWVKKLLIGAVFALGPIIIVGVFFLAGYLVEIVRRVSTGSDQPLPEWRGNFGAFFKQGFPVVWGLLIWLIPYFALWSGAGLASGLSADSPIAVQLVFGLGSLLLANLYAAVLLPSVVGRYAASPRFGAMFEFGAIFGSVRRIGIGFVAVLIVHLVVLALTFVTIWAIVAIILTTSYAVMAFGHAYGQAARIGYGETPLPPPEGG